MTFFLSPEETNKTNKKLTKNSNKNYQEMPFIQPDLHEERKKNTATIYNLCKF